MTRRFSNVLTKHHCQLRDQRLSRSQLPPILPYSTLWQKLKRKISKLMLANKNHPDTHKYLKSELAIANENRRLLKEHPWFLIHPLSMFQFYWGIFMFFMASTHNAISPYFLAYFLNFDDNLFAVLKVLDTVCCVFLLVEFALALITGYVVETTTEIVLAPKAIMERLIKKYLVLSIFGIIPYFMYAEAFVDKYSAPANTGLRVLIIFLFVMDILRLDFFLERYFHVIAAVFEMSDSTRTLMKLVVTAVFVLHWTSCLWYILPFLEEITDISRQFDTEYNPIEQIFNDAITLNLGFVNETTTIITAWDLLRQKGVALNQTNRSRYFRALYVTTMLSLNCSYGIEIAENDVSFILASFIKICGWVFFSSCFLYGIKILESLKISVYKYEEVLREIKDFCEVKKLSKRLELNILTYFKTKLKGQYFNEKAINETISENLRKDILMHTCQKLVQKVELFNHLPKTMITDIVRCLTLEIYLANEVIIRKGMVGEEMFFLATGTAAVLANDREIAHLMDGDYFGEISLIYRGQRRTATVVAVEVCEVYKLSYQDFNLLFQPHKDLLDKLKEMAIKRLSHNQDEFRQEIIENFVYN